jgi:transposase
MCRAVTSVRPVPTYDPFSERSSARMTTVAEVVDLVIGGDTHRDTHTLEVSSPVGAVLARLEITNTPEGFAEAICWIGEHACGPRLMVGLEGTRSYGVGLCRALQRAGLTVVEVERPKRQLRHGKGKSDPIDAHHASLSLLRMDISALPQPRADGDREALRILLISRNGQVLTRTRQANQLHALLLTGDDSDRALNKGTFSTTRLVQIAHRTLPPNPELEQTIRLQEATRLAQALLQADQDIAANEAQLRKIVKAMRPDLLALHGVGPISAAQALVTFSHAGRCRNEAAFAMPSGTAPLPASSGQTRRHRLNRGGDRQLNRALHTIALSRWRTCPETADYIAKRRAQGLSDREIRRCLKRYISRQIYRQLTSTTT